MHNSLCSVCHFDQSGNTREIDSAALWWQWRTSVPVQCHQKHGQFVREVPKPDRNWIILPVIKSAAFPLEAYRTTARLARGIFDGDPSFAEFSVDINCLKRILFKGEALFSALLTVECNKELLSLEGASLSISQCLVNHCHTLNESWAKICIKVPLELPNL